MPSPQSTLHPEARGILSKCKPGHVIFLLKTLQWLPMTPRNKSRSHISWFLAAFSTICDLSYFSLHPLLCSSLLCSSVNSPNSLPPQDLYICCFHFLECSFSILPSRLLLIPRISAERSPPQDDHALYCPPHRNKMCHSGFSGS